MTGETERSPSGWTIDTLKVLSDERERFGEQRLAWAEKFENERDRRYSEVKNAEEKALRIKEEADKAALGLAREIQTYKDEKANELREQISRERGEYVSRTEYLVQLKGIEDTLKPIRDYIASQQGRSAGIGASAATLIAVVTIVLTVVGLIIAVIIATH